MARRVGLFVYGYPMSSSPSLMYATEMLAEEGFHIDVFLYPKGFSIPIVKHHRIHLHLFDHGSTVARAEASSSDVAKSLPAHMGLLRSRLRAYLPTTLANHIRTLRNSLMQRWLVLQYVRQLQTYVAWANTICSRYRYTCFIGAAEPPGLVAAARIGRGLNVPVIYYSLELLLSRELGGQSLLVRAWKKWERQYIRYANLTLVQDEERAELLAADNQISRKDIMLVPVGVRGSSQRQRTDYLRRKFAIQPDKVILLFIGGFDEWNLCLETVEAARTWPANWVLILHGVARNESYLDRVRMAVAPGKVFISLDFLTFEELDDLVASGDVGIVLYQDRGLNWRTTGLSSGKLAHYLKCGLPVVASAFPSMRRIIEQSGSGICVAGPEGVAWAVRSILAEYEVYRSNAFRCYEKRYCFDKHFGRVVDWIRSLDQRGLKHGND